MPIDSSKLRKVYATLQQGGYEQDYDTFARGFAGNDHYANRKKVYDLLSANGAQVGDSYEDFMQRMQKGYSPRPLTGEDRRRMAGGAAGVVAQAQASLRQTKNRMDHAMANAGLRVPGVTVGDRDSGVRLGQNSKVVAKKPQYNPQTGKTERTYITESGNEYTDRASADLEQNGIDEARFQTERQEAYLLREKRRIEQEMNRRGSELDAEAVNFSWRDMPRGGGGAVHTYNSATANGRFADGKYKALLAQLNKVNDGLATIEEAKRGRASDRWIDDSSNWASKKGKQLLAFGAGAWRGLAHAVGKPSTWDMGMTDMTANVALHSAAVDADRKGTDNLSREDRDLLNLTAYTDAVKGGSAKYLGRGYKAGQTAGESLPFMVETMLNPASRLGTAATNKLMREAIGRYGKEAVKKASKRYLAAKIGTRLVGDAAGSAVMAGTTGQGHALADTLNRLTGDVQFKADDSGKIVYGGREGAEDSVLKAYLKAFGAQAIENHSEMVGAYFAPFLGKASSLTRKGMGKIGLGRVNKFIDDIGATNTAKMIGDFEKRTKWNGTLGEYAEEVAGNIENALLVGDSTLDTAENTGVFNLDRNIDTFLGVGLMGGFFAGANTLSYRGPKRQAINEMSAAGKAIDRAIASTGNYAMAERWGGWRNTFLAGTDEEKKAALREVMDNGELPMGFRMGVLDFVKAAQKYEGIARAQESKVKSGEQDPVAQAYDESYSEGYETTAPQAMNDAKNLLDMRRGRLAKELGTDAGGVDALVGGDPLRYIEERRRQGRTDGLQAVIDYANAKSAYDGMMQRVQDDIDSRVEESDAAVDSRVNSADGMIHPATLKLQNGDGSDRRAYVVSGNVVMYEDGRGVDMEKSDSTVVIRDAVTGEKRVVPPDLVLGMDAAIDPGEEKARAREAIIEEMSQRAAHSVDGRVPFNAGDTYTLTGENGEQTQVTLAANEQGLVDNGDGTVNVTADGGRTVAPMGREDIQRGVDATNKARTMEAERERQAGGGSVQVAPGGVEYGVNDTFTLLDGAGATVHGEVQGVSEDGVEIRTDEPWNGRRVQVIPAAEFEEMVERISDADGNLVWEREYAGEADAAEEAPGNPAQQGGEPAQRQPEAQGVQREAEASALSRVPINEDTGEPMFEKADSETALDALGEVTGGSAENTAAIVNAQLEQAQKAVEALRKKRPTKKAAALKGSPMAMAEAQRAADAAYSSAMERYGAQVAEAEGTLDAWTKIHALMDGRKRAERERQEAERRERDAQAHDAAVAQVAEQKRVAAEKAREQAGVGAHAVNPKLKEKWDKAAKVEGNANAIPLADGSTLRGRYVLTEAGAASASHDISNAFEPTEGFPVDENGESVNDRDYKRDTDARRIVMDMARNYDGRALQPPVIVSKDGVVLSGNNRTMSGDLAAQQGTDKAYVDYLREFGRMYGFTPEQVGGMRHPRVVFVPDGELPYDAATFARFNAETQKRQGKDAQAVKLGKVVPDSVFSGIVGDISRYDRLSDYYADSKAVSAAISRLLGAGVINEMQLPEMRTGNALSAAGKELIENTLIGKVFQSSPDAVRQIIATPTLRQSVMMALGEIARNRTLAKSGYDLSQELGAAVGLVARARGAHPDIFKDGVPVSPFGRQQGLFDDEYGDSRVTDAIVLLLADILNSGKPSDLRKVLATYNHEAEAPAGGQMDMFSGKVETKEELLNRITEYFRNATPREQQAIVDAAVAERKKRAEASGEAGDAAGRSGEAEDAGGHSLSSQNTEVRNAENVGNRQKNNSEKANTDKITPVGESDFGFVYDQFKGDVQGAIQQLIKMQDGEALGALHHNEIGDIDLVWGKAGTRKSDGYGLAKLVKFHPEVLDNLQGILDGMRVTKRSENRVQLENDEYQAAVRLTWNGNEKLWLLTAFRKKETSEPTNSRTDVDSNLDGKSDDTAPRQSSDVSVRKDTEQSADLQGKGGKSSANEGEMPLSEQVETASAEAGTEPTEAQKEAGNYRKGHVQVGTFDITIEQPEGSVRKGTDAIKEFEEANEHLGDVEQEWEDRILDYVYEHYPTQATVSAETTSPKGIKEREAMKNDPVLKRMRKESDTAFNEADKAVTEAWMRMEAAEAELKRRPKPRLQKADDYSAFAEQYGLDAEDVAMYADGMATDNLALATQGLAEIRRAKRIEHHAENPFGSKLSEFAKSFAPIRDALYERFGNVDELKQEYIRRAEEERNMMEAARKKAEEEEAKRKQRQEELSVLTADEIDKRYAKAIERGDEHTAREMLDEAARRKGYGDTKSEYQGVGAWEAPSNPGYESDEARRADVEENAPDVNLEDMALGYNLQPDDYFTHPERYSQNTSHGLESTRAIRTALDALKRGDKDVKVKVYRAVPTSVKEGRLRNGDWVTPSRKYAEMHGNSRLEGKYRIIEDEVPVKYLWWDGNDANEWGYDNGNTYKYKNAKNNRKLNDLVTRDDKGNVVAPSKRFNQRKADERYQKGDGEAVGERERVLRDAVIDRLRDGGMEVITDVEEGQMVLDEANGNVKFQMGDTPETFAERQKRAVENRGVVMPGLDKAEVDVVRDIPRHGYTGSIAEATKQAIQMAKEKYAPKGKAKVLHYGNNGTKFDYTISGNAIEICLSPKHQARSESKGLHLALAEHLDEVIGKSVEVEEHPDYIKDKDGKRGEEINPNAIMHRFYGVAIIDDVPCRIMTLMREEKSSATSNGIHSYEVQKIEVLDNKLPSTSNGVGSQNQFKTGSSYPLAKLLKGIEKSYDKGKFLLDESKKSTDSIREHRVYHGSGAKNYVVFDEKDARIAGHVRFFRTAEGEAYGFTVGGKIYIDPGIANAETPVHEYAHLWASALEAGNPKEWRNVVGLVKGTPVWDEVKRRYPELETDDEIADEVLATYSGRRGAERLREEAKRIADGGGSVFDKAEAVSALGRVKAALERFWKAVADFLHIRYTSAEEVADRVMKDLLDGVDPRKFGGSMQSKARKQFIGEQGAERADHAEEVSTRLDNLSVAREMEKAKKDAKAIKMATGWERGADGKWRYEIPDVSYRANGDAGFKQAERKQPWSKELSELEDRLFDGEELSDKEMKRFDELVAKHDQFKSEYMNREKPHLADWVEADELFKAYPGLKRTEVLFTDQLPTNVYGRYEESKNLILVNSGMDVDVRRVLGHEIQHAIQSIEGFAEGGSVEGIRQRFDAAKQEWRARSWADALRDKAEEIGEHYNQLAVEKALIDEYKEMGMDNDEWMPDKETREKGFNYFARGYADRSLDGDIKHFRLDESVRADFNPLTEYTRLGGEVESRNVEKRMDMTPDERRVSLAADTEDVSRGDQIFLYGGEYANDESVSLFNEGAENSPGNVEADKTKFRLLEDEELERVNDKFNERLSELVENPNQKDKVLRLGRASQFLRNGGMADAEIVLEFDKLARKSKEGYKHEHPFDMADIEDLPKAIAFPIAVFDNTNGRNDGKVILTELEKEGRNFIVAVQTVRQNRKGGVVLEVNQIVTLFPKDARGIVNWFNLGKATNIDKEKALHFIEALPNHPGTTIKDEELLSAANVVRNFEKTKVLDENVTDEDKTKFRLLEDDDPKAMELEALPESELVPVYRNVQAFEDDALGSPMAFADAETGERRTLEGGKWNYSNPPEIHLTDEQQRKLDELNKNGYIMVDGKKTTELPINEGLKFVKPKTKEAQLQYFLKKNPEDKGLWAAYDPYDHAIETPLNTQFGEAYKRPNLVVVRSLIPKSEIDEPFHADYALLPTGAHQWNNGRTLYLSRWSKIDKVLTREEEAKMIDEYWKKHPGKREALKTHRDYNRFVPQVRRELEKMGYRFELDGRELTPEESRALDEQNWESRDAIPGREGQLPFIGDEDIARINAKMAGKWVGEPKEAMENAMAARVNELAERLHTPVRIVRTAGEVAALPSARQRRMKGSFNPLTGEVTIVVPNNANMADVENTFVHEVVGHGGLRVLFPEEEKLDSALDELYRVSDGSIREAIDRTAKRMYDAEVDRLREKKRREHEARGEDASASYYADMAEAHAEASRKRGQFRRDATEEYGADLAGRIGEKGFERMGDGELTFWGRLKAMLQKALQKLLDGLKIPGKRKWSDKDWAFVLHEAYKRKKNGGKPTVFDAADTEVMRRKTGFGETKFSEGKVGQKTIVATTIAGMKQRVAELFEKAKTGEFVGKPASIGRLSADGKAYLEKLSGLKFKEFVDFVLNPSDLNHIRSDHYGENEKDKGNNVLLTDEDIQNMVDVLNQPDGILYGVDKKDGRKLFFFLKDAGNGLYNLTEVCSTKKGNLTAKSFFKSKKKGISQRVMEIKDSLLPTSVTYSGEFLSSDAKIPTLFEINESSSENVADEDLMFRDGDSVEYNKAMARDIYERRVRRGMYQVQEALQDSMLGLKEAMDAVLKAEGRGKTYIEDVAGYENAYLGENRLAGKNKAEADEFSRTLFKPMLEEVARLAKSADERAGLTDYMMAKHGLERNEVMARRAAEKDAAREFHAELRKAERAVAQDPQDQGAADALDDVKRRRHDREEELYLENRGRDYAGLTALTGKGSVAEAEAEARKMVADYEAGHDTRALWYRVNAVNAATLRTTYESGLISKATYDDISGMYAHYIPLRGFDEKTAEEAYAYLSDRHGAFSAPIKAARGRKSKADDPFANMEAMAESAIMQGNRNVLVKQKFLNFALNHPSDLVSVSDLWLWHNDATDEWQPVNSGDLKGTERIGEDDSPAEVERKMRDFEDAVEQAAKSDPAHYRRQKDAPDIPYRVVESRDLRQHQVLVKRNGRDYLLTVNGNPRAAQALNGLTNPDNDISGAIGVLMKSGEWVNRQLSAFYTTRNPDFVVSNFVRDLLYTNTMVWVKESPNYAWRFHKNFAKVNPARMKVLLAKLRKGTLDMNDGTERMFRLFMMNGGETGYANIRDIDKRKNDIRRELKKYNGQMPVRKAWSLLGERLDEYNRAVENCARFAAFMTSRQMGRTVDRSVYDAKEISVNFNKKGSGAKFMGATGQTKAGNVAAFTSGLGRSFYVFWNAAIQGTANFGRQFRRHPGKAIAGAASMFLLGALVASIGGDDGDGDGDEDAYWNLPDYVRRSNIVFRLPGMDRSWISLPLPVEYRAMYGMGELAVSAMSGRERHTPLELAHAMAGQVSQLFPIDFMEGGGGLKAFVPSPVKPAAEVIDNESWTGMPIYKDTPFNRDMPEWTKAYKSANKYLVGLSRALNEATGGDAYTSGAVDINPAQVEHLLNGTFGGVSQTIDKLTKTGETILGDREYDPRSFLLLNRLVKRGDERTEYRAINNEYFRIKEESEKLRKRLNRYENDTDDGIFDYAEKIARINASPEYRMLETYEECSGDIDAINDELKEEMPDEERKSLEAELNQKKKELVDAVNAIRNGKR